MAIKVIDDTNHGVFNLSIQVGDNSKIREINNEEIINYVIYLMDPKSVTILVVDYFFFLLMAINGVTGI